MVLVWAEAQPPLHLAAVEQFILEKCTGSLCLMMIALSKDRFQVLKEVQEVILSCGSRVLRSKKVRDVLVLQKFVAG